MKSETVQKNAASIYTNKRFDRCKMKDSLSHREIIATIRRKLREKSKGPQKQIVFKKLSSSKHKEGERKTFTQEKGQNQDSLKNYDGVLKKITYFKNKRKHFQEEEVWIQISSSDEEEKKLEITQNIAFNRIINKNRKNRFQDLKNIIRQRKQIQNCNNYERQVQHSFQISEGVSSDHQSEKNSQSFESQSPCSPKTTQNRQFSPQTLQSIVEKQSNRNIFAEQYHSSYLNIQKIIARRFTSTDGDCQAVRETFFELTGDTEYENLLLSIFTKVIGKLNWALKLVGGIKKQQIILKKGRNFLKELLNYKQWMPPKQCATFLNVIKIISDIQRVFIPIDDIISLCSAIYKKEKTFSLGAFLSRKQEIKQKSEPPNIQCKRGMKTFLRKLQRESPINRKKRLDKRYRTIASLYLAFRDEKIIKQLIQKEYPQIKISPQGIRKALKEIMRYSIAKIIQISKEIREKIESLPNFQMSRQNIDKLVDHPMTEKFKTALFRVCSHGPHLTKPAVEECIKIIRECFQGEKTNLSADLIKS